MFIIYKNDLLAKATYKIKTFMQGRYGIDQLYRTLLVCWLVLTISSSIIGIFSRSRMPSFIIMLIELPLAAWMIFRVFSRNITKRTAENMKYLVLVSKLKRHFKLTRARVKDHKTSRYRKCPHCKNAVRVKNQKGSHNVRCPICSETFRIRIIL